MVTVLSEPGAEQVTTTQCADVFGDFTHVCQLPMDHDGPHRCEPTCAWEWWEVSL